MFSYFRLPVVVCFSLAMFSATGCVADPADSDGLQSDGLQEDVETTSDAVTDRPVGSIVWGTATYRLTFYENKNYTGKLYSYYLNHKIGRKRTRIGYEWVDSTYETNLPSDFRKITSSYKMEYLSVPNIDGYWMVMEMKLRTGLLEDDANVNWTKKLYQNPQAGTSSTLERESDFSDNRIWGSAGIPTWNDQIQSFSIRFNSF